MEPLQLFTYINIFIVGAVVALALQYAYAHFRPPHKEEKVHPAAPTIHISPEMRDQLIEQSKAKFQAIVTHSAADLEHGLSTTASQLNQALEKLGDEIIADEMKRYKANLDQLRNAAETTIQTAQVDISKHQDDLKRKLAEEIAAEKQRLLQQIDTKLADAVMSFLMETLQHNVDLGAQGDYLIAMLDEHKAELTKGVADEA